MKCGPGPRAGLPTNSSGYIAWRCQKWTGKVQRITRQTAEAGHPARVRAARGRTVPRPIPVTGRVVSDVLQALASLVMVSSRLVPAQPVWLPAWPEGIAAPLSAPGSGDRAGLAGG